LVVDCVDGGGCIEWMRRTTIMSSSNAPTVAVRRYVDAFNNGDAKAMAAACANPMPILDGMSPHVWQGSTAAEDWWRDVLAEGEHLGVSGYHITLGEPRHVDLTDDYGYVVVPATMTFNIQGTQVTQSGSVFTVALRKVDRDCDLLPGRGRRAICSGQEPQRVSASVSVVPLSRASRVLLPIPSRR